MRAISQKIRKEIAEDPAYRMCMLKAYPGHECGGRITIEHALLFAGRQVGFKNALIAICARGHEVDHYQDAGTMDKNMNRWVALNRMTEEEIESISKAVNWGREKERLNRIYGIYIPTIPQVNIRNLEINYGF